MFKDNIMICDVCGATSDEKIIQYVTRAGMHLCSKHKKQIYEYGKITDPTARTTHDRNEYILHDDYAEMVLRDRRNNIVGYAKIDLEDVEKCKQQKWSYPKTDSKKCKKYVRAKSTKINVSLQRYILNYDGPLDVDHINRDTLDNRKSNLRIVSRTVNCSNNGHEGVYKSGNRWRVKLTRYGKIYYSYGCGFDTKEEAIEYRDNILEDIEANKEQLQREFDEARKGCPTGVTRTPNGTWRATYYVNGQRIRESGFPTMEAAANRRAEMIGVMTNAG